MRTAFKVLSTLALSFFVVGVSKLVADSGDESLKQSNVRFVKDALEEVQVFIANGFDDNDLVEFVVTGYFLSPCYRFAHDIRSEQSQKNIIDLKLSATEYLDCSKNLKSPQRVPVAKIISAPFPGILSAGTYNISINEKPINVNFAIASRKGETDQVDIVLPEVEQITLNDNLEVRISGAILRDERSVDGFKLVQQSDQILVVIPMLKDDQSAKAGDQWIRTFKLPEKMVASFKSGERLYFHIRSQQFTINGLKGVPKHFVKFPLRTKTEK